MDAPADFRHSHTHSMRTTAGDEVLVVRVLDAGGAEGYGFSFVEDVAAARAMALWHAAALRTARPVNELLREADANVRRALEDAAPRTHQDHPWVFAWRATLAAAFEGGPSPSPVDWNAEPGFAALRWVDPA